MFKSIFVRINVPSGCNAQVSKIDTVIFVKTRGPMRSQYQFIGRVWSIKSIATTENRFVCSVINMCQLKAAIRVPIADHHSGDVMQVRFYGGDLVSQFFITRDIYIHTQN